MKILLVCTGNTCRSSMGEAIMKKVLASTGLEDIEVQSAGLAAIPNQCASKYAIEVMKENNIDLNQHKSRQLTDSMVIDADIILTMTTDHKNAIVSRWPEVADKTFTLKEGAVDSKFSIKMNREFDNIYDKIDLKRQEFLDKYREEIVKLNDEKIKIKKRIKEIDETLRQLEIKFQDQIDEEKRRLKEVEERVGCPDVIDPFGGDIYEYRRCADEITQSIEKIAKRLKKLDDRHSLDCH